MVIDQLRSSLVDHLSGQKMSDERDKFTQRQNRLIAHFKQLFREVEQILFKFDPIGIAFVGHDKVADNPDEYSPEVGTILPRLSDANSPDDVTQIVYEEFGHWFGVDEIGPKEKYVDLSNEIWLAWNHYKDLVE